MAVRTKIRRNFSYKANNKEEMTEKEKLNDEINNGDELVEKILNSKKVRYEVLDKLFKYMPKGKDTVTIYIDIMSVINGLYNPKVVEEIKFFDERKRAIISSNIINMAAHFRNYFATRKDMFTNIIFFYSSERAKNEVEVYPNYKMDYYNKRLNDEGNNSDYMNLNNLIEENFKLCKIVCDYLPHIYFIDTKEVNPFLVPYFFIRGTEDNEIPIIYSNDKLQMLNCLIKKDTYLLTSSFSQAILYGKNDFIEYYLGKDPDEWDGINPTLIPYLFAISGVKKYNIDGLKKYGEVKALKLIQKLISDGFIINSRYKNYELFLEGIQKADYITLEQYNIIKRNLEIIDQKAMFSKLNESTKLKAFDCKDLQDLKSLLSINDEYYDFYPLMIEELLLGEDYESV